GELPDEPACRPGGKPHGLPPARERHGHELGEDAEREGRPAEPREPEGGVEAARLAVPGDGTYERTGDRHPLKTEHRSSIAREQLIERTSPFTGDRRLLAIDLGTLGGKI